MTTLPNWVARCAANEPNKLAIRCGSTDWSFAQLYEHAVRLAHDLAAVGVVQGDRIALLAANGLPYVVTVHALTLLDAVLVPLNTRLTDDEIRWQLGDVHAAHLLYDERWAVVAERVCATLPTLPHTLLRDAQFGDDSLGEPKNQENAVTLHDTIDLDALQAIIYTSGTTGQPKGTSITYGMQWWNAIGSALNLGHDPSDRWLVCLPMFHVGGLTILFRSVIAGVGVVVHERFDAATINRSIWDDSVTIISVVAVMVQRLLDASGDVAYPPTLRCMLLGGGPAPLPLLEACAARGIPIVQTYGMTESCSQAVTLAPDAAIRKLGSAGRPLAAVQLRIVHEGTLAIADEVGEIQLRGPTITLGYIDRPEATARAFGAEGWFATGDLGYLDAEGYLYIVDRRTDLIISGGENVYPAEIEAALLAHPAVAEAGVCGIADAQWGSVPIAFVHLRSEGETTAEVLRAFLAERLARYKLPHAIHIVGPLPRNSAGKLLRRELLAMLPHNTLS